MRFISLQSGSSGNCIYVEAGDRKLLFDAGIPGVHAARRLAACGRDIRDVDALIISHDHGDHARCIGVYQRKFALPVCITKTTLAAARRYPLGSLREVRFFRSGQKITFGRVTVETIRTPHDAADPVAFVVDDGDCRLGIMTDLGHVFDALPDVMASLDAVLIESNYDPPSLAHGPYPQLLKDRIKGNGGHLANEESAGLLVGAASRLRWACLGHMSEANNTPQLAMKAHRAAIGQGLPIHLAGRYEPTEVLKL